MVAGKNASVDEAPQGSRMEEERRRRIETKQEKKNARGHRSCQANGCIVGKIANEVWPVGVRREPRTGGILKEVF